jgi:hypothetical protein
MEAWRRTVIDAVAVTVKDSSGSVYYDSETALPPPGRRPPLRRRP